MPQVTRFTRAVILLLLIAFSLLPALSAFSLTPDEQRLLSHISAAEIRKTVTDLCCDRFAGRQAGTPGQELAAQYIAGQFQRMNLDKVAGSYTQPLTMRFSYIKSEYDIKATMTYSDGKTEKRQVFSYPDYYGRGGIDLKAPVIFVGEGITDPSSGKDDYSGTDAQDKVVAILAGTPARSGPASSVSGRVLNAYQHGALAVLVVGLKKPTDKEYGGIGLAGSIADFPCLSIRPETARSLFPGTWDKLTKTGTAVDTARVGRTVRITVPAIYNPQQPTRNVLSCLEPEEGVDDYILLGAHYDHLGQASRGKIFYGADDNASGTAVMLEVARAIAESGLKPRNGIVFAAWTAEECGLIGSNYFVKAPPFPVEKLKVSLNMDMVGAGERGKYKTAGRATCPQQFEALSSVAKELGLEVLPDEVRAASDNLAFSRKGIPSLLVHAAGEHPNYHTVQDRPETLDPVILENTAKLVALTMWRLANE